MPLDIPRSHLSLLFIPLLLILSVQSSHAAASVLEGTVVKIADGDTITVLDSNKVQHKVRLAGIDAPRQGQVGKELFRLADPRIDLMISLR